MAVVQSPLIKQLRIVCHRTWSRLKRNSHRFPSDNLFRISNVKHNISACIKMFEIRV